VRLVGRAKRVVPYQRLDVVLEPGAVVGHANHPALVRPFSRRAQIIRPSLKRHRQLNRIAEAERRAPRLLARAPGARQRDAQVEVGRQVVAETHLSDIAPRRVSNCLISGA
jgi:hypothetical protein